MLVSSFVIEIKTLLIDHILEHFVHHPVCRTHSDSEGAATDGFAVGADGGDGTASEGISTFFQSSPGFTIRAISVPTFTSFTSSWT
jgi:hypothetical protein